MDAQDIQDDWSDAAPAVEGAVQPDIIGLSIWGLSSVGEHLLCKQGVRGSNPLASTKLDKIKNLYDRVHFDAVTCPVLARQSVAAKIITIGLRANGLCPHGKASCLRTDGRAGSRLTERQPERVQIVVSHLAQRLWNAAAQLVPR